MNTERFDLIEQIGAGGMGAVWKARDRESGELVALKFIHELIADDPEYVRRFENEVEAARRVHSPNVVQVLGYGRRGGQPYLVMEYVDGRPLADVLAERKTIPWQEARTIARAVANALAAAHRAGVIHRDVKPSNILVGNDGSVKLADFGIARTAGLTRLTQGPIGTLAYMAPDVQPTPASDLYSLGCVLFEMLTGRPPFRGGTVTAMLKAHAFERPPVHLAPVPARPLLRALLEKKPARRPASAGALASALDGGPLLRAAPPPAAHTAIRGLVRAQARTPLWVRLIGPAVAGIYFLVTR